ncbi:hypothetical protein EAF04_008161 [Stromatinia cepivora]|nr:hypothetical protein EAF04_008161 [Stromatinia cepivora]
MLKVCTVAAASYRAFCVLPRIPRRNPWAHKLRRTDGHVRRNVHFIYDSSKSYELIGILASGRYLFLLADMRSRCPSDGKDDRDRDRLSIQKGKHLEEALTIGSIFSLIIAAFLRVSVALCISSRHYTGSIISVNREKSKAPDLGRCTTVEVERSTNGHCNLLVSSMIIVS